MNKTHILLTILLVIVPVVIAGPIQNTHEQALQARTAHLACAVERAKTQLDILNTQTQKDVTQLKSNLDADLTHLKELVTQKNRKGFDDTAKTLRTDLNIARDTIKETRDTKSENENKDKESRDNKKVARDAAKEQLQSAQEAFKTCQNNALKTQAQAMNDIADTATKRWQQKIDDFKAKGIKTDELQNVLDEAKAEKEKLALTISTSDPNELTDAMKAWRESNLHIHARFEIAKLRASISTLEERAATHNTNIDLAPAKKLLEQAEGLLSPGTAYGSGEFESVWKAIKEANQKLKSSIKQAKSLLKKNKTQNNTSKGGSSNE
ncbi:MAG: hypothetical protein AABX52_01250 [Nanoarchaeota archaeon]